MKTSENKVLNILKVWWTGHIAWWRNTFISQNLKSTWIVTG